MGETLPEKDDNSDEKKISKKKTTLVSKFSKKSTIK